MNNELYSAARSDTQQYNMYYTTMNESFVVVLDEPKILEDVLMLGYTLVLVSIIISILVSVSKFVTYLYVQQRENLVDYENAKPCLDDCESFSLWLGLALFFVGFLLVLSTFVA